ncbi:hypothetical protein BBJ28_00004797 [Nothophytophthora sp. Chile5]|nr:hypothetical protein BBJ28_00004797 [Nothophytophthora sp. Chile5]
MPLRPATGHYRKTGTASVATGHQPLQGKLRPHSAALLSLESSSGNATGTVAAAGSGGNRERVGATSDELIRDLEHKVRKVVELKRAESDKLRFAVAKKRDEVGKAKLILQDLMKDSEALGLYYQASNNQIEESGSRGQLSRDPNIGEAGGADEIVEEPNRLQPIASISRRPVYSKHTKINEWEAKLEKRAQASHDVLRNTLVLEHIKKRLLNERVEITQETNELKARFADLNHLTQELQKRDIAASEAVSQVQTRLAQQKADMAANLRKYKREVDMRHKWAREKAKFEKYYNDQVQTLMEARQNAVWVRGGRAYSPWMAKELTLVIDARAMSGSPSRLRRQNVASTPSTEEVDSQEEYRQAFLRIGFGHHSEGVDPEEIIHTWLAHEEIKKELDAKHDEDMEQIAVIRDQLAQTRSLATENVPLSKRGTSQRLETKEIELSSVERAFATVVDQYMFVDQSVRPLKIGLQQILQNVTSETVNVDDMNGLEKALTDTIEEMMRLVTESRPEAEAPSNQLPIESSQLQVEDTPSSAETEGNRSPQAGNAPVLSAESFTSPFNIRIPPKPKEPYYVLGVTAEAQPMKPLDDGKVTAVDYLVVEPEELDFDVMDRSTVKRISSVLACTSTGKKSKDGGFGGTLGFAKK